MRIPTEKVLKRDGTSFRRKRDLRKMLNVNIFNLLEKAQRTEHDMPVLLCNTDIYPDFLALYNQPSSYCYSAHTAVCFYLYDYYFDGLYGLYNAIYYNDKILLAFYKERFRGVKYFISPDYSVFGDHYEPENEYRIWKARIVSLWLALELRAVVIPNATYVSEDSFPKYFGGLEACSVLAFSTKGHIRYSHERTLLTSAVQYAVDNLPLKAIIVYSVCGKDVTSLRLFRYAEEKGIKVIIPNNTLRERNRKRCGNK